MKFFRNMNTGPGCIIETQNLVHKAKAEAEHTSLVCYAQTLKNYHQNLKERIQALLRMLRKEGVLLSEKKE